MYGRPGTSLAAAWMPDGGSDKDTEAWIAAFNVEETNTMKMHLRCQFTSYL